MGYFYLTDVRTASIPYHLASLAENSFFARRLRDAWQRKSYRQKYLQPSETGVFGSVAEEPGMGAALPDNPCIVDNSAADDGQDRPQVFDGFVGHARRVEKVIAENNYVGQLTGLDRAELVLIE